MPARAPATRVERDAPTSRPPAATRLRTVERRVALERLLRSAGTLTLADARARFAVSPMTIRRDFAELESRRIAVRTHGGIVLRSLLPPAALAAAAARGVASAPPRRSAVSPATAHHSAAAASTAPLSAAAREADAARRALAERAVETLRRGETIFLDGGPLAAPVAAAIVARGLHVDVVTTSLAAASLLARHDSPPVAVTLTGGRFDPPSRSFTGPTALAAIARHYADRALVSATDPHLLPVTRAMLDHAHEGLVLGEPTRVG